MKNKFDIKNKFYSVKSYDYPFKHIIIEDFLPEDIYLNAESMFHDDFFKKKIKVDKNIGSNKAAGFNLLNDTEILEYGLKNYREIFEILKFFATKELHKLLRKLFGDSLIEVYKNGTGDINLPKDYLSKIKMGNDSFNNAKTQSQINYDLTLYTSIKYGINTPSFGAPTSVRDIHIDNPTKLYNALIYFRDDKDHYAGGDLLFYRFKNNKVKLYDGVYASHEDCVVSKVIPYRRNTLVLFLNSPESIHGVVERSNVPIERRYINISSSFRFNQFEILKYQNKRRNFFKNPKNSIKNFIKTR